MCVSLHLVWYLEIVSKKQSIPWDQLGVVPITPQTTPIPLLQAR